MTVTKCDRCGKLWSPPDFDGTRHDGHFLITWISGLAEMECDLCMDCMDDFEKFMKTKSEKE